MTTPRGGGREYDRLPVEIQHQANRAVKTGRMRGDSNATIAATVVQVVAEAVRESGADDQ